MTAQKSKAEIYLEEHGITEASVKKFNLTWDENFLNIPIKDENGEFMFTKSRNLNYTKEGGEPKYKNSAGSHATLFNRDAVKDSPTIVLCEGEIDCIRLTQGDIPSVSSTGGASTFLPEWKSFFENKNVFICLDNDKAGIEGLRKTLELIPHARVVQLPEGVKDICEFFAEYSKKDFAQLLRNSLTKSEWEAQTRPEEFNTLTLEEITKMEFPEQPWLIKNVLYNEGFCFIYGAEGTGKSFVALTIADSVATGKPWLGHFEVTNTTNILILDKENPLSMVSKRAKGLGVTASNIHYLQYPEKFSLVDSKGEYSAFALTLSQIVEEKKIGLVILDSFVDFMLGSESSAEDTQAFFNAFREIFAGRAFIALHHENKPSQGVFRNDSQRLRGSSNINAQTFTSFRLESVAKSKTEFTLKQTKARDSLKLDKFAVEMKIDTDEKGDTYVSDLVYKGEVEEGVEETKITEAEAIIQEMVMSQRIVRKAQIIELLSGKGISERTANRTLKKMLEDGTISENRQGKEKVYAINLFTTTSEDPTEVLNGELEDEF